MKKEDIIQCETCDHELVDGANSPCKECIESWEKERKTPSYHQSREGTSGFTEFMGQTIPNSIMMAYLSWPGSLPTRQVADFANVSKRQARIWTEHWVSKGILVRDEEYLELKYKLNRESDIVRALEMLVSAINRTIIGD